MSTTYEPPLTGGLAQPGEILLREVIETGPAYIRGPRSTRWHRVRSAYRAIRQHHVGDTVEPVLVEHYQHWCGSSTAWWPGSRHHGTRPWFRDDPAVGEPACGTCEGRAIGADRTRTHWLFTPRRLEPPARCPGSHTMLVREDQGAWNRATCLVCGDVVKLGAHGGPYATLFDARVHPPGPGLIDGCPFHAWRDLVAATHPDGHQVATCRCNTKETPR